MLCVCWESIFSKLTGMGSVQKKSWLRAVSESILTAGLRVRSLSSRSTAHWSFTYGFSLSFTLLFCIFGISILLYRSSSSTPGHTSGCIAPHSCAISVSWCCSVFPCMMGDLVHISAMIQPAPHMSTGGP